ncbi:MAG: ribonuclease H family protein [Bacteroidota bacterium]|nr:ribonuclease H family protein [Bacteroidota bacterium]MDP4205557.1 ribonuclease H family protein [Bacteroidota bacterium]
MSEKKYYVVWKGHQPGIYEKWQDCQKQISGYPGAIYKAFPSKEIAEAAFYSPPENYLGKKNFKPKVDKEELKRIGTPISDSLCVDGAWNTASGDVEYQGVYTKTGKKIFRMGPFRDGSNNIGEFLGIVHALAYLKKNNLSIPVYSDSKTAISWVRNKKTKTTIKPSESNKELFELLKRAEKWLSENSYPNRVLKWETKAWGEIPADFGRK